MNPQTFIFIGPSGCGKGTQAQFLMSYLKENDSNARGIYYMESGAQFREFIKGPSYSSHVSKEVYDRGDRQPSFLAIWNWANTFIQNLNGQEHIIIDGTPRTLIEALALDTALEFYKRKANVIYLNVSPQWSQKLLLARGRMDDASLAKINLRLGWFKTDVIPAIDHMRDNPFYNFIEINGEQGKEDVFKDIVSKLILY